MANNTQSGSNANVSKKPRYATIINGEKIYLNPEQQKAWDSMKNTTRNYARKIGACGQPDFRKCEGDCELCPWHRQGFVLSTDHEDFNEGSTRRSESGAVKQPAEPVSASAESLALTRITLENIFRYADETETNGAEILRRHFECPEDPTSGRKIAEALDMAPSTVNDIIRRLLKHIRENRAQFLG